MEERLLQERCAGLPEALCAAMVGFANEVRKLFMGQGDNLDSGIEVTFSTRALLRWADLTLRFQPLARQGIQPVTYALDRALAYRASPETRAMLHELAQRIFPQHEENQEGGQDKPTGSPYLTGAEGIRFLTNRLATAKRGRGGSIHLRKTAITAEGERAKK